MKPIRSLLRCLVALAIVVPASLHAASRTIIAAARDGSRIEAELPAAGESSVIIEFRNRPLFARAAGAPRAAALKSFTTRFAQFEDDLRNIDAALARRRAAAARPVITHTFERVFSGVSASVPAAAVPEIQKLSYVAHVWRDGVMRALADDSISKIGADRVWTTYGTRGAGVVVAVIDTGIDYLHPAFGGAFGRGAKVIGGHDFVNGDDDPYDDSGHGTHVAGIIGAAGGGLLGVAPDVSLLAYKVLDANGRGKESDILAAVERTVDPNQDGDPSDHADVANLSLGGLGDVDQPLPKAVEAATAAGVVFVISSGNSGGFFSISSPGNAPSAITVGATDLGDFVTNFSSSGPSGRDLAIKPEVVAPGTNIVSAAAGGGTIAHSGTSMAAPHVAGVAALVKARNPQWTPAQVKAAIVTTAQPVNGDVLTQGGGRVDALRAVGADLLASPPTLAFGRDPSSQATWTATKTIQLTNYSAVATTLWTSWTAPLNGVRLSISPDTVTIAAGQTQEFSVRLDVDNKQLPFPVGGSMSLSGRIEFSGGKTTIRIPWAFVKAARITVQYDREEPVSLFAAGAGSSKYIGYRSNYPGTNTMDVYVPPGSYDLFLDVLSAASLDPVERVIFLPRAELDDSISYDLKEEMASSEIAYASKNSTGTLLRDLGKAPGSCSDNFILVFPSDSSLEWLDIISEQDDGTPFRIFTSAASGVTLTGSEACWDRESALHIAHYGTIASDSSAVLAVDPSTWQRIPLSLAGREGLTKPLVQFGWTILSRHASWTSFTAHSRQIPLIGSTWNGSIFMTPERHASITTVALLSLKHTVNGSSTTAIDGRVIRSTDDGVMLWPYLKKGPTTYIAKRDELLSFGEGLPHPDTYIVASSDSLTTGMNWIGALDENRPIAAGDASMALRRSDGTTIASGTALGYLKLDRADIYELETKLPFLLRGITGEAQFTAHFDTRLADTAPPLLRCLRIVDGDGRVATALWRGGSGTLRFAAIDSVYDPVKRSTLNGPIDIARSALQWRPHATTAWQSLPLTVEAQEIANTADEYSALGHQPAGVVFASDLAPALRDASGAIDIRLHVQDPLGNAIDYTLSPALTITTGRRRAAMP